MNDFTKEELQSMHNWGWVYCEFGQSWTYNVHKPLLDKIQSMIDNYCEHTEKVMDVNGGISLVCKKCGITVMDV